MTCNSVTPEGHPLLLTRKRRTSGHPVTPKCLCCLLQQTRLPLDVACSCFRLLETPQDMSRALNCWRNGAKVEADKQRGGCWCGGDRNPLLSLKQCPPFPSGQQEVPQQEVGSRLLHCGWDRKRRRESARWPPLQVKAPWAPSCRTIPTPAGHFPEAGAMEEEASSMLLPVPEEPSVPTLWTGLGKSLSAALSVAAVVLGGLYYGQCPRQPLLPVYLVVLGAAVLLLLLLSCVPCGDGTPQPSPLTRGLRAIGLLFLCAWFVAGSVWVYTIYPPDYEVPGQASFCHRTLFLFAFGVTTAVHALLAAVLLLVLCALGGTVVFGTLLPYGGHGSRGGP